MSSVSFPTPGWSDTFLGPLVMVSLGMGMLLWESRSSLWILNPEHSVQSFCLLSQTEPILVLRPPSWPHLCPASTGSVCRSLFLRTEGRVLEMNYSMAREELNQMVARQRWDGKPPANIKQQSYLHLWKGHMGFLKQKLLSGDCYLIKEEDLKQE